MRWVYLDIGKFGGLAETMDELIRYPIRTPRDGGEIGPCVLAGPTCDSVDVLYEKTPYELPVSLEIGDKVLIEGTGAYTTTYASVGLQRLRAAEGLSHLTSLACDARSGDRRRRTAKLMLAEHLRSRHCRLLVQQSSSIPANASPRRSTGRLAMVRFVTNKRPTSPRARRCSTRPSARAGSPNPPSACARTIARGRPVVCGDQDGRVVGTVRLWHISAGPDRPALLLGPLAVDPAHRNCGLGAA